MEPAQYKQVTNLRFDLRSRDLSHFDMYEHRRLSKLLVPIYKAEEKFLPGYGERLLADYIGMPQEPIGTALRDEAYLRSFIGKNTPGELPSIPNVNIKDYLLDGFSLLEYLQGDNDCTDQGWQYPTPEYLKVLKTSAAIHKDTLKDIDHRELLLSPSISEIEADIFKEWLDGKIKKMNKEYPMRCISFSAQCIQIRRSDYHALMRVARESDRYVFNIPKPDLSEPGIETENLVARFAIGDGVTFVATFLLPIKTVERSCGEAFEVDGIALPDYIKRIFENVPSLGGVGAIETRNLVEQQISDLFHAPDFGLNGAIEVNALGAFLGYDLPESDWFTWHLVSTGQLLNTQVLRADNGMNKSWAELSTSFKSLIVSNVASGHILLTVLLSMMVRDLFPDPSAICELVELHQKHTIDFLSRTFVHCLMETKPKALEERPQRNDRLSLAKSLTTVEDVDYTYNTHGRPELMCKLISDWPMITRGGARFLHPVRIRTQAQYFVLVDLIRGTGLTLRYVSPNLSRKHDDKEVVELAFLRGYNDCNFKPVYEPTLQCDPSIDDIFDLKGTDDVIMIDDDALKRQADLNNKGYKMGLYEYLRIHPRLIDEMMKRMNEVDLSLKKYKIISDRTSLFTKFKNIYDFLYDEYPTVVPYMEDLINKRFDNEYKKENTARNHDADLLQKAQQKAGYQEDQTVISRIQELKDRVQKRDLRLNIFDTDRHKQLTATAGSSKIGSQTNAFKIIPGDHRARNKRSQQDAKQKKQKLQAAGKYDCNFKAKLKASGRWDPNYKKNLLQKSKLFQDCLKQNKDQREYLNMKHAKFPTLSSPMEQASTEADMNQHDDDDVQMIESPPPAAARPLVTTKELAQMSQPSYANFAHAREARSDQGSRFQTTGRWPARRAQPIPRRQTIRGSLDSDNESELSERSFSSVNNYLN